MNTNLLLLLCSFILICLFIYLNSDSSQKNSEPNINKTQTYSLPKAKASINKNIISNEEPLQLTNCANDDIDYNHQFVKDSALGDSYSTNGINNY